MKIGNWTILNLAFKRKYEKYYNCVCVCGKEKIVCIKNIKQGKSKSCGCLRIGKSNW